MKKLVLLVVSIILATSLVACGGSNSNSGSNNSASSSGSSASSSSASSSSSAAVSGDPQGNKNLVSIGTTATSTFENRSGVKHSVSMRVDEVIRGDAALSFINDKMMAEKKSWSAAAPDDPNQEYIVVKITYTLLAFDEGDVRAISFCYAYTGAFEAYPSLAAAMYYDKDHGYPRLSNTEIKVGDTITGYEVFQISKADASPTMAYGATLADLSNGLWFKLY